MPRPLRRRPRPSRRGVRPTRRALAVLRTTLARCTQTWHDDTHRGQGGTAPAASAACCTCARLDAASRVVQVAWRRLVADAERRADEARAAADAVRRDDEERSRRAGIHILRAWCGARERLTARRFVHLCVDIGPDRVLEIDRRIVSTFDLFQVFIHGVTSIPPCMQRLDGPEVSYAQSFARTKVDKVQGNQLLLILTQVPVLSPKKQPQWLSHRCYGMIQQ